ncbi:hypothetical protein C8Q77DRAFT_1076022 [Trametes polyzona]|nr:hypothetical protein C8Q77DRAFT_1076022 [Trametes polyzona]
MTTFFPLPLTYAVAEIDVLKTLQPLDDPIAITEGARIKTTKCIVYLACVLQLPFPDDQTIRYNIHLVGPGMRPADPELCLTPDMCVPILPETYHPSGKRKPLEPEPPFPFRNCYHWYGPDMVLDVRIANDGTRYSKDDRTSLSGVQHYDMEWWRGEDMSRWLKGQQGLRQAVQSDGETLQADTSTPMANTSQERTGTAVVQHDDTPTEVRPEHAQVEVEQAPMSAQRRTDDPPSTPLSVETTASRLHNNDASPPGRPADLKSTHCYSERDYESSVYDPYCEGSEGHSSSTVASVADMDIFGRDQDYSDVLLPVVKVSFDLAGHFKADDIPSPVDFLQQRDQLVRIIGESRARARAREIVVSKAEERSLSLKSGNSSCSISDGSSSASGRRRRSKGFWSKLVDASSVVLCMR